MESSNLLEQETIPSFEELLSDLSDDEVEKFSQYLERNEYVPGETIFYQNEPGNTLYVIQVGTVEIAKMIDEDEENYTPLVKLKDGNIFGEISFIMESERSASAVATTHVVLYSMSRSNFNKIVDDHPTLACQVYKAILKILAYRLRRTDLKLLKVTEDTEFPDPVSSES